MRRVSLPLALMALAACARPPGVLRGTFPPLTVAEAQREAGVGERVRWGGEIVSATPEASETCFEIVSKLLDREARPGSGDESFGRFIACAPGFYDPAIYAPGREVTVVGTVEPVTDGQVGEVEYAFARVRAETVYLWPRRVPRDVVYYPYGYGWGWGYPGWGWGGGVGWGWGGRYFVGRTVRPGRH